MKCPKCNNGKQTVEVTEIKPEGRSVTKVEITCITCNGSGQIEKRKLKAQERAFNAFWCRCGNPSEEIDFFDDGQHPGCEKHHYRCRDCGKVTQVG